MNYPFRKYSLQVYLAILISLMGMLLLFSSLLLPPRGDVASSVLVAYGEVMTFAGALLGIDYHYKRK